MRRATSDTDEPGVNVAATISRFNDSGHDRCRRRRLFVSIIEFVDTSLTTPQSNIEVSVIPAGTRRAPYTGGILGNPIRLASGGESGDADTQWSMFSCCCGLR